LKYNEFIAPLVGAVQELSKKVKMLEEEIKELKQKK
jgi:cell division protein FtsB